MPNKKPASKTRQIKLAKSKKRTAAQKESTSDLDESESITSESNNARKKVRWDGGIESTTGDEQSAEEESLPSNKVCLAAFYQSGRLGCAYYDPVKSVVYVLEDTQENAHFDLTKILLEQAGPDVVITSSKTEDPFIDVLRDHMETTGGIFQIRPFKDFTAAKGRDRLLSLRMLSTLFNGEAGSHYSEISDNSEPRNAYDFMQRRKDVNGDPTMQRWNASIRISNYASVENSPLCLGSIGALLDHLVRTRAVSELNEEGIGGLEVDAIEAVTLDQFMHINADALFSLQIFENENHASVHSDKTKEGLSLFGILNNTSTTLGRSLMREWLLRPSLSLSVISSRHDVIECFSRAENLTIANSMLNHLKGLKNVPRFLMALRTGKAKVSDWQGMVKFTFHAVMLRDSLTELSHVSGVDIVRKLVESLDIGSFRDVGSAVNETIDWEESSNAGRVCVRPHVDEELDYLKHIYNGIDAVLCKVAEQISVSVPSEYATSLNVVYFPQLGFLICVPMKEEWQTNTGVVALDGWSFQFSSESHVYFKTEQMHDMDAHIGDLHPSIVDREIEIIQSLLEKILVFDDAMLSACYVCAELDCLLSFAQASRTYDYRRPDMSEENIIDIQQGRHPLQELVVDTFVPNDVLIVGGDWVNEAQETVRSDHGILERNSIVICTGANACGKSVYLKQVALIQYMAQIGCFVPAEYARLGIVDKIFTRIQTRESVSKVQSAFMIDLNQVSLAIRNSTSRSLILLDEFGKGTVSADGAGLLCGVLQHFIGRGTGSPKVLAATHFHDIFKLELFDAPSLPVTCLHMQIMLASSKGDLIDPSAESIGEAEEEMDKIARVPPGERITYLYRVARGLSLVSHAAICAEIFGIPRRVTERAQLVSKLLSDHELGQLLDEAMHVEEREELEVSEDICRRFLAQDLNQQETKNVRAVLCEILGKSQDMP